MDILQEVLLDSFNETIDMKDLLKLYESVDSLYSFNESDELYLEVVKDQRANDRRFVKNGINNTIDTLGSVKDVGGTLVNAKAGIYKSLWNMFFSVFKAAATVFRWIASKVSAFILSINKLQNKISDIPGNVLAKIRGDIKLYITIDDLKMIYNSSIVYQLNDFIVDLSEFVKGDSWTMFLFKDKFKAKGDKRANNQDLKLAKKMKVVSSNLNHIKFEPTLVKMDVEENRKIYFGNEKALSFRDNNGVDHNDTYYEALKQLLTDLSSKKQEISSLEKEFSAKLDKTKLNQQWATLTDRTRRFIRDRFEDISIVIGTIGSISKYITIDINTIDSTVNKIIQASNKK